MKKTNGTDIEKLSCNCLNTKREILKRALSAEELTENEILPLMMGGVVCPGAGHTGYTAFLELAADLNLALQRKHWDCADEIAESIMASGIYRTDRRCVRILYELLEEYCDEWDD